MAVLLLLTLRLLQTLNTLLSTQLGGRFSRRQPRRTEDAVVKARTL
jgi:hypothetical protein